MRNLFAVHCGMQQNTKKIKWKKKKNQVIRSTIFTCFTFFFHVLLCTLSTWYSCTHLVHRMHFTLLLWRLSRSVIRYVCDYVPHLIFCLLHFFVVVVLFSANKNKANSAIGSNFDCSSIEPVVGTTSCVCFCFVPDMIATKEGLWCGALVCLIAETTGKQWDDG